MTKAAIIASAVVFAITGAVQLGAQSTKPAESSPTAQAGTETTVKITGCLQRAEDSGAPGDEFVLINARASSGMASGSSGANGQTSGGTGGARDNANRAMPYGSSGPWFMVDGDKDELRGAAGHQVEITGTIERAAAGSVEPRGTSGRATAGAGTATSEATAASGASAGAPTDTSLVDAPMSAHMGSRLHVDSMRIINATCAD